MPNTASLQSLRDTLSLLPVEWILWAIEADWTLAVAEGPGLRRIGLQPGAAVGTDVRERLADAEGGHELLCSLERGPASGRLVIGSEAFFVSGARTPSGGAIGLALPAGSAAYDAPMVSPVLEVTRPVLSVGARPGDLLVYTSDDPAHAGLFRRVPVAELPAEVRAELERVSSPPGGGAGGRASGASRSLRERAAHLRLLP
jgi:hypothetical protein